MAEIAVITSLSHSLLSLTVGSTPALRLGRPIGQCSPRVFAVWGPFVPNCQRKCENVSTPKPQLCTRSSTISKFLANALVQGGLTASFTLYQL